MPPKKRKKLKKPAPQKESPGIPEIPQAPVIPTVPEATVPTPPKPGRPCICIKNADGWFCMKQLPNGELKECDGPFDTKEECEEHVCR